MINFKNPFTNIKKGLKGKFSTIKILNKDTGNLDDFISHETIPRGATFDANLVVTEIYNAGNEDIILENMIFPNGPEFIKCNADALAILPHRYYIAKNKSGAPITLVYNYGSNMMKGNKLPSNPNNVLLS